MTKIYDPILFAKLVQKF